MGRPRRSTQSERSKRGDRAEASRSQVAANAMRKAGNHPATWRPEAAAGSVEHSKIARGRGPILHFFAGLGVLCPLDSFTIEHYAPVTLPQIAAGAVVRRGRSDAPNNTRDNANRSRGRREATRNDNSK